MPTLLLKLVSKVCVQKSSTTGLPFWTAVRGKFEKTARQQPHDRIHQTDSKLCQWTSNRGSKYTPDDIGRVPNSKITFLKMGAFLLLREWPKLTIFSFAEQEWHLHGPGWLGWPKGEILCTRISFRCLQLTFLTLRYSLLPSMLTYSVLYPSANIVQQKCFRDEGPLDWHEVGRWSNCNLHKNGFRWESLRFLVYGGLCHAPLVFNWLRLAARMFPKVPEYSDSKSFSFIILSSTLQCAGHNRASCSKSDPRSNMFCTGKLDNSETDTEVKPQCLCQVGLTCFYVGLSTLEGKSREGIFKEWKEKFPNTWAVSS